ncbi:DUF4387 domain-containing protein [Paramaledivibacter caminithermalis]|jgi:hypothetical protein|uniref:DUF4387 domain-containing protein n=1 Tax=Paramaledivibacter caminithermalis (strain DSM 15212 / CIP 107654 / DViRD3) TaxID=1121301 RepID=A0A1M6RXG1_PARC5|nr:DUF4387 domain-containing protein [Paramaledivibacter caminithermalis]SHK37018.1 protein of unknown function [Paramaledivibacter caminithermalis DSM 15212]
MENTLYELAKVIRSKNSGPFKITLDILFDEKSKYERVKNSGVLTKEIISKLYNIPKTSITGLIFFDQALGIKITFLRDISSGTIGDRDVYGAQQHAPLMEILIP